MAHIIHSTTIINQNNALRVIPGIWFQLTNNGNYAMENKFLKSCVSPLDSQAARSKNCFGWIVQKLSNFKVILKQV